MAANLCDVLNLEWRSNKCRDREVATLVANYIRLKGYKVVEGSIFNGYRLIDKLKPKILYLSNSVGARLNVDVIRYAKSKGITCVTGVVEGNFNEIGTEQFIWGVNNEQILYEDACFLWNSRSLSMTLQKLLTLGNYMGVDGAAGFNGYKIVKDETPEWLKKIASNYEQVVVVGAWNFDFTIEAAKDYKEFNGLSISNDVLQFFKRER